jgi:hypothetical protein
MNGKEASANYDKVGHKLATEIEIKESDLSKALTYISTTILIKKSKKLLKLQIIKGNYL